MKRISIILLQLILFTYSYSQTNELNFNYQLIDFSSVPRTAINTMSIKLWDSYNNGGPSTYGTVLELYGRNGHQTSQLNFGGWDNSKIRYREAFYNQNTWSEWITLLDSKNDVESQGNLRISGIGAHYILKGNVGIGTTTINNAQGWNKVVDEYASGHAKLLVRTDNIITGIFSHDTWNGAVGRIGTESPHDLRLMAGYGHEVMSLTISGNVGIGTPTPDQKLTVKGKIHAEEVIIDLAVPADYVFKPNYKLMPLHQVEQFVKANSHLPEIPSASEITKNGLSMGEMQNKLLQKVEELTLYAIQQDKSKIELERKYNALLEKVEMLTKQIEKK